MLRVSTGNFGGHRGYWWWNEEVKGKAEANKVVYAKLVERKDEREKRTNKERYKKEAK